MRAAIRRSLLLAAALAWPPAIAPATAAPADCPLPARFEWASSGVLVRPVSDASHALVAVKDPTVVRYQGRWHIYATTADTYGRWSMAYLSFADWPDAASAVPYYIDRNPAIGRGYRAAPQLFYFTPQRKWYLVYQSGAPMYSTTDDMTHPETWTAPKPFYASEPPIVTANKGAGEWLDFWVICDAARCHMFSSDVNGHWYRSETSIADFPGGFGPPVIVMEDPNRFNLFEATNVYRLKGAGRYLALIEAVGPTGRRYFRSWSAASLEGPWSAGADAWVNPFAGEVNVGFGAGVKRWTQDVSHGEMLREGYDETLTVDPCHLQYLYQGKDPAATGEYALLPWRLGLLRQASGGVVSSIVTTLAPVALPVAAAALLLVGFGALRRRSAR